MTFKVVAKDGTYEVGAGDLPAVAQLVVGSPAPPTGQCAQATFPATPPAKPSCALSPTGTKLVCK